jgi:transcriptional regulator with XRE-family HTH domain
VNLKKQFGVLRKSGGLTQRTLADRIGVGIASIKRWENTSIQSDSMDRLLRACLTEVRQADGYNGNRPLSLPRVKLVIRHFEGILNRRLLKKTDKFLFVAKYLWYADMLAYARLGRSRTGAAYAAITYGPQGYGRQ